MRTLPRRPLSSTAVPRAALAVAALLGAASSAATARATPLTQAQVQTIVNNQVATFAQQHSGIESAAGLSVAVSYGSLPIVYGTYGVTNPNGGAAQAVTSLTDFWMGSVSKTFTSTLFAYSIGKAPGITLNATAYPLMKELNCSGGHCPPTSCNSGITLLQLADFWSGLEDSFPGWVDDESWNELYQAVYFNASWAPITSCTNTQDGNVHTPGTAYRYSNFGYDVLGDILGDAWNTSWRDATVDNVIIPLGLDYTDVRAELQQPTTAGSSCVYSSTTTPPWTCTPVPLPTPIADQYDVELPSGGLWSNARDMGIWLQYNLGKLTSPTSLTSLVPTLQSIYVPADQPNGEEDHWANGLAWQFNDTIYKDASNQPVQVMNKDGGVPGFTANVCLLPSVGMGVSVQSNIVTSGGQGGILTVDTLCKAILQNLLTP